MSTPQLRLISSTKVKEDTEPLVLKSDKTDPFSEKNTLFNDDDDDDDAVEKKTSTPKNLTLFAPSFFKNTYAVAKATLTTPWYIIGHLFSLS